MHKIHQSVLSLIYKYILSQILSSVLYAPVASTSECYARFFIHPVILYTNILIFKIIIKPNSYESSTSFVFCESAVTLLTMLCIINHATGMHTDKAITKRCNPTRNNSYSDHCRVPKTLRGIQDRYNLGKRRQIKFLQ